MNCQSGSPNRRASSCEAAIASSPGSIDVVPRAACAADRGDRRRRRVARHRARVAEAEVDVLVPVHVDHARADRLGDEDGEAPGPARHPAHGNAAEERAPSLLEELERARVLGTKPLLLAPEQLVEPGAVEPRRCDLRHQESFTATCLIRVYSSIE